ncbi:universal stress protein [Streptomyces sp. 35G-GA-8]|uniref:universal stress protein n=1 Tax=Streptomyces sp. 35G-GA-8 TaxID=2939434 RepID=UPI00201F2D86|nr:universal stress protein [Streptomyces sp. 35G-GA-8]MCL7377703.1 universal stress protein [Streptomyces sp. 35G-GA-8]
MERSGGRRVVVGVSGTLGSLTALHRAAAEARRADAELWAVLAWAPPGGEPSRRGSSGPSLLDECRWAAVERLLQATRTAFGDAGPGVPMEGLVVRGTPGAVLTGAANSPEDLLVVGAGVRGRLRRALRPSVARYCLAHASCPVLAVPPSPLQDGIDAVKRRIAWHMPLDTRELAD